jgi:hypothetical protein
MLPPLAENKIAPPRHLRPDKPGKEEANPIETFEERSPMIRVGHIMFVLVEIPLLIKRVVSRKKTDAYQACRPGRSFPPGS